ncbi:hypothetical protein [Thiomonas sp.]
MTAPVVALDVDGVLADFGAHWRQCAGRVLGREISSANDHHSLRDRHALTAKEIDAVWELLRRTGRLAA